MVRAMLLLVLVASTLIAATPTARAPAPYPDKARARIVLSQDQQRMLIYEGDTLLRSLPISTGWPGKRETATPAWSGPIGDYWGTFASFGTVQDDGYWLFTDYLADGRWNGDILIHGAPYVFGPNGEKVYDLTGIGAAPVSHGCIRLFPADMAWFRSWDPQGVPLAIEPFGAGPSVVPKIVLAALMVGTAAPGQTP